MNILVTGSSGNIGSAVAETVSGYANVIGLDVRPGHWTTHIGSIEDAGLLKSIIPEVDGIIHCAAFLTPHVGNVPESRFVDVNVHGTENLLNLAIQHRINRFVFTSTTSVYGCSTREKMEAIWVTESLEPFPEDIYDQTKLKGEALCREAAEQGLSSVVLRMSRCFPESDHLMLFYRLYRGVNRRDVAMAHWLAMTAELNQFEIFNISSNSPFKKVDCPALLADPWPVIEQAFPGSMAKYDALGWQRPASIDRVYVVEKAQSLLGYQPEENFAELSEQFPLASGRNSSIS